MELSNVFVEDCKLLIEELKVKGRDYIEAEQNVVATCKKYFISYKEMLEKIEAYKNTLLDVKLIYNTEEKVKLYSDCAQQYKRLS